MLSNSMRLLFGRKLTVLMSQSAPCYRCTVAHWHDFDTTKLAESTASHPSRAPAVRSLCLISPRKNTAGSRYKGEESANSWLELKSFWMHIKIWRYITKPCMQQLHSIIYYKYNTDTCIITMIHHSGCLDASWNSVSSSLEHIEGNQPPCLTINRTLQQQPLLIESTSMTEHQTQLDPWPQPWLGDNDSSKSLPMFPLQNWTFIRFLATIFDYLLFWIERPTKSSLEKMSKKTPWFCKLRALRWHHPVQGKVCRWWVERNKHWHGTMSLEMKSLSPNHGHCCWMTSWPNSWPNLKVHCTISKSILLKRCWMRCWNNSASSILRCLFTEH